MGPGDWANMNAPGPRDLLGRIRRFALGITTRAFWQVVGHVLDDGTTETHDIEPFSGVGFFSRPPSSSRAEVIVVYVGGPQSPAIVASRDEDVRRAVAADLAEDETQIHNSKAIVRIKAGGTVEIRLAGGVALPLATKADLAALASFVQGMTLAVSGATAGPPAPGTVPTGAGTTVLKAQ